MQCDVSSRHSGPPEGRASGDPAGSSVQDPVPVPSRPVGGTHAVTPGGWRALTAGRHCNARADNPANVNTAQ